MKRPQIFIILVILLLASFVVYFWRATKEVRHGYDIAYDAKLLDLCGMQMESLGILLDIYQAGHHGQFPSDINLLFSDPNVIKAKGIAGISGTGTGKHYRTRQERLKDLLGCPGDETQSNMSYVYRGSELRVPFSEDTILLYDKPTNHNSLSVINVLFYKTEPRVERISTEELEELISGKQ